MDFKTQIGTVHLVRYAFEGYESHLDRTLDVSLTRWPDGIIVSAGMTLDVQGANHNFMTACFPNSLRSWSFFAKDCRQTAKAKLTAFIYVLEPAAGVDIQIFSRTVNEPDPAPECTVTLPTGYIVIGGGACAHWSRYGQYLTASNPTEAGDGWHARSEQHIDGDPGTLTVYAVGAKLAAGRIDAQIMADTSISPSSAPEMDVSVDEGYELIGGGGRVEVGGLGNMLTNSYPVANSEGTGLFREWEVRAHDSEQLDQRRITAFAIGLKRAG